LEYAQYDLAIQVIIYIVKAIMPIRVSAKNEALGLDHSEHSENAYPTFVGLDS